MSNLEAESPTPGSVFDGKYQILELIGRGGFGRVYRARQLSTSQLVAIKVQHVPESEPEEVQARLRERFLRETKLCAELTHPNVVRLLDSSIPGAGLAYGAFEYVPGSTLAQMLSPGEPLPPREVGRWMIQVMDALAAAHRLGIVHRDLKTENVMVSGTGALRNAHVLDFGLGGFAEARRASERRVTLSREFMGTPLYAAPEQLRGEPATPRSDLYAWGLVLLECLTGRHPFEGGEALEQRFGAEAGRAGLELPEALRDHPLGALIARVTAPDPAERDVEPSEIVRVLEGVRWEELQTRLASPERLMPPRGARRQVTILSCRTRVSLEADFEGRHAILRAGYAICAEAAGRYGGQVSSAVGDRVLVHFGFPVAHESDARRAARAALEIAHRVAQHVDAVHARGGPNAEVRIGIHTGPVIARDTQAGGAALELDLAGSTAEVAAQLDMLAEPGDILVGATTQRLLRGTLGTTRHSGEVSGLPSGLAVYRLEPEGKHADDTEGLPYALAGRSLELRQLSDGLEEARQGRPRCVVVAGEPGIGKSRLVRELRRSAPALRWLFCRCLEDTRDTPLHPVIALLHALEAPVVEVLPRYGLDTDVYAPLFRRLLGLGEDPLSPAPVLSPEREKFMLLDGLSRLIRALALEEPLVLVVEDVHWADPTTRELLQEVIGRLELDDPTPSLLLLLTSRDWAPSGSSVITLPRLSAEEVEAMVRDAPALPEPLPAEVVQGIVAKADGIPLFVEEVTRVVVEQIRSQGPEAVGRADLRIPAELEALLQARIDTLSEPARATLQLAAAVGREFPYALLKAASGAPDAELESELSELTRGGFVTLRRSIAGEHYVFRHAMIRAAAYTTMLADARRDRHARIASLLEGRFSELARAQPEMLARHLEGAGESARAGAAWQVAGIDAMGKGAYVEAIRHFESGLAILAGVEDPEARRRLELELTSSLGTALIATTGYAAPRVGETFARASALCEELGEDPPLALLYGVWSVHLVRGDVEATAALLPRFRELAERQDDDVAMLTVHAILGLRALLLGQLDEAERELDRAVAILGRPGSLEALAQMPYSGAVYPIAWQTVLRLYRGRPAEARASRDQLNQIAKRIGNPYGIAIAGHFSALLARDLGDVEEAQRLADQQIAHSQEQKILLWQCSSACIRGWARALAGDVEGAAELATNVALLRGIGMRTTLPTLQGFLAEAQLAGGQADVARATAAEARADCETILDRYFLPELLRIEARCLRASGDTDAARARLDEALGLAREQGSSWFALRAASDRVELDADAPAVRSELRKALDAVEGGDGVEVVERARQQLD